MKIKSLLIGMLACSAMVACTNEDAPVNGENNKFNGEKAYLAVNIVTSEANSRAAGAEGYVDGTLFFVKSARYGKPDKDFVRLFISIPVHFTTS